MIDDQEFEKSEGTEIKWKEGKDITKKTVTKKQKNKKTGKTRSITKTVDADSFFNFFKTITPKDAPEEEDEDAEGDEDTERLALNFNVALTIQEEIIPYHLEYYLGLRTGDEDMDDDELGEIGEEDEDDDDDDDDHEGHGHKHGKHGHQGHSHGKRSSKDKKEGGAGGEAKQECKQQ